MLAGYAAKIDTIPIPTPIRQIMPEMRPRQTHRLPVRKAPHILPNHLFIPKTGPPMRQTLFDEFCLGAATGCDEEGFACDRVVVDSLSITNRVQVSDKGARVLECITTMFSIVPVVIADPICCLKVTPVLQIRLTRHFRRTMRFLAHNRTATLKRILTSS